MPPTAAARRRLKSALPLVAAIAFASLGRAALFPTADAAPVVLLAQPPAPAHPVILKEHTGWVGGIAFAPDGTLTTACADGRVRFWDAAGKLRHTLAAHDDIVSAVAFAKDGTRFATASFDGTVKVWNAADRKLVHTLTGARGAVLTVAFNPNGKALSAGGLDGTVRAWELDDKEPRARTQRVHASWANAIAYRPDGLGLASVGSDNEIRFNPKIGKLVIVRPKLAEVRSAAYSPDGKLLATGTRYGVTAVWDANGDAVATLKGKHSGDVWGVAFSADGKWLAAADGDWNKPSDVVLWDTTAWKEVARLPHTNEVLCVAFHPAKPLLAAGAWDKTARVWDLSELGKGKR